MHLISLLVAAAVHAAAAASCPDLAGLRSSAVANMSAVEIAQSLDGFWYENAFIDIAQIGASCQTLNSTIAGPEWQAGRVDMDFAVKYIGELIPFHITESYKPDDVIPGVFMKHAASVPGGKILQLPTAVVSATPDAFVLFSCLKEPILPPVTELVIASRKETMDDATVASLIAMAQAQGVPFDESDVKRVNHTGCD
jgi:hypothetical protein